MKIRFSLFKIIGHFFVIGVLLLCATAEADSKARTLIRIGAYGFEPYFDASKGGGLLGQVVRLLNQKQSKFQFSITEIPSKRRYQLFSERRFDMIFFEDDKWGWKDIPHYVVPLQIPGQDGDVYIASKKDGRTQKFFDDFSGKSIAGILGYHYGFAKLETDAERLRAKFDIFLGIYNEASIRLVLNKRVDLAVVPKSYIRSYLKEFPDVKNQIIISERFDQKYDLHVLVHPKAPVPRDALEELMKEIIALPEYKQLFSMDY